MDLKQIMASLALLGSGSLLTACDKESADKSKAKGEATKSAETPAAKDSPKAAELKTPPADAKEVPKAEGDTKAADAKKAEGTCAPGGCAPGKCGGHAPKDGEKKEAGEGKDAKPAEGTPEKK